MNLDEFCRALANEADLSHAHKAVALLWWHDEQERGAAISATALAKLLREHGVGNPNASALKTAIGRLRMTVTVHGKLKIKAARRTEMRTMLSRVLAGEPAPVAHESGYLPRHVWKDTRGYIERVCQEMNACHQYGFHNAASVLLRRLVETLLIEVYEHLGRQAEVKGADENYKMLGELVAHATATTGLSVGRETKTALKAVKELGDRAAHNRRFIAEKADMDRLQSAVRVLCDDLVGIADLRPRRSSS